MIENLPCRKDLLVCVSEEALGSIHSRQIDFLSVGQASFKLVAILLPPILACLVT